MKNTNNSQDTFFLQKTLRLAKKGLSFTSPNPMVGSIIVKNGKIIGTGFHKKVGLPHAEIEVLKSAKVDVKGATMYVSLEPCTVFGRTPPCVNAIIKAGIARVVCCTLDPNPKVAGKGIEILQKAGIQIEYGFLEKEAELLNETFFTFHSKKRPFVAIKFAASLDGKIATKTYDSKWITNEKARKYARSLRGDYQAILVGINTVLNDNPNLGVNLKNMKDPLRIILDSKLEISLQAQVLRDNNVLICVEKSASLEKIKLFKEKGIDIIQFSTEKIEIIDLLTELKKREIISLFVEGGGEVLGSFLDCKFIDKVYVFHSPILIGGKQAVTISGNGIEKISDAPRLKNISYKKFDDNLLTTGYFH